DREALHNRGKDHQGGGRDQACDQYLFQPVENAKEHRKCLSAQGWRAPSRRRFRYCLVRAPLHALFARVTGALESPPLETTRARVHTPLPGLTRAFDHWLTVA